MNIKKDWMAKLESAYSFMLKYSKITVCYITFFHQHATKLKYEKGKGEKVPFKN